MLSVDLLIPVIVLLLFLFKKVTFEAIPSRHCCLHFSKWLMLWNSAFLSARCGRGTLMIKVRFPGRKIHPTIFMGSSILFHTFYTCGKPLGGKTNSRISHPQLKESTELLSPVITNATKLTQCRDHTHE